MSDSQLLKALQRLEASDVIGLPTETVYGLAARIDRPAGIDRIFEVKQRPFFDPLIVHVSSIEQARSCVDKWPRAAEALARRFWPGPLTLVLKKQSWINDKITSGLDSVGLRCPKHPLALELLRQCPAPLAAPSANRFGRTSPTTADHVRSEFPDLDLLILDGGPCEIGIESTVLRLSESAEGLQIAILRPGAITQKEIQQVLELERISFSIQSLTDRKDSPGQLQHHYMPEVPLIWIEGTVSEQALLTWVRQELSKLPDEVEGVHLKKPTTGFHNPGRLQLSDSPRLAARELYAQLRLLSSKHDLLLFEFQEHMKDPAWSGILDRLQKAASLKVSAKILG